LIARSMGRLEAQQVQHLLHGDLGAEPVEVDVPLQTRGIEGVRVLQGLLSLVHRHDTEAISNAIRDSEAETPAPAACGARGPAPTAGEVSALNWPKQ
jgi:hypothetical protein